MFVKTAPQVYFANHLLYSCVFEASDSIRRGSLDLGYPHGEMWFAALAGSLLNEAAISS